MSGSAPKPCVYQKKFVHLRTKQTDPTFPTPKTQKHRFSRQNHHTKFNAAKVALMTGWVMEIDTFSGAD